MSDHGVETSITLKYAQGSQQNCPSQQLRMTFTGPKLHGLRITNSELDYHGSITIDAEILESAGLLPLEFVNIWNKSSGTRIQTYILPGERGTGIVCLNGAAARTCQVGDDVIITSERTIDGSKALSPGFVYESLVITFKHDQRVNTIGEILRYHVQVDEQGTASFNLDKVK